MSCEGYELRAASHELPAAERPAAREHPGVGVRVIPLLLVSIRLVSVVARPGCPWQARRVEGRGYNTPARVAWYCLPARHVALASQVFPVGKRTREMRD